MMEQKQMLYSGKAKTLFSTEDPNTLICHFRDDTSAFDGQKIKQLSRKGLVNNYTNALVMTYLQEQGIENHFIERLNETDSLVKKLEMIPVECVVRNVAAGGLCRRLGVERGLKLDPPIIELFLKNDELHDPMVNLSHIQTFCWASEAEVKQMIKQSIKINELLKKLFDQASMMLVDFKLEFGRYRNQIILGDEFTADGCRLWDKQTHKVLDKDRFRQDLGDVVESYQEVAQRLGISLP